MTQPPRILYLGYDLFSFGGIQRFSRYEIRALADLYGEGTVRACSLLPPSAEGFSADLKVDIVGAGESLLDKLRFARRILGMKYETDLVICDHVSLALLGYLASRRTNAPVCVNVHGLEVWKRLLPWRAWAMKRVRLVLSVSAFTKGMLERHVPSLMGRVEVVHDCVDVGHFVPAASDTALKDRIGVDSHRRIVLTIARIVRGRSKGHEIVMRALARLEDAGKGFDYVVVGDGDDRARLEALSRDIGVAGAVHFTGRIPDEELAAFYNLCDVFALASGFRLGRHPEGEGLPLAALEAQSSGKPVVTSKFDGSAEAISDGETGLAVDPHDLDDVANALERILGDEALRREMGHAARARAEEEFSFETYRENLGRALAPLLARSGSVVRGP